MAVKTESDGIKWDPEPVTDGIKWDQPTAAQQLAPEKGDFMRGLARTLPEAKQLTGGSLAYLGDITGLDSVKEYGLGVYKRGEEASQALQKDTDSFTAAKEKGVGGLIDFAQNAAGYVTGQALETGAAALGGALIGSGAAPGPGTVAGAIAGAVGKTAAKKLVKEAVKDFVKDQVVKGVSKSAAKAEGKNIAAKELGQIAAREATEAELKSGARKVGASAALGATNLNMELGSIYGTAEQKAVEDGRELSGTDKARILGSALTAAGVETLTDKFALGKVADGVGGDKLAKRLLREVPSGMVREGSTEALQTGIERFGAGQELASEEAMRDYIDSGAVGALGGGLFGTAASFQKSQPKQKITINPVTKEQAEIVSLPVPQPIQAPVEQPAPTAAEQLALPAPSGFTVDSQGNAVASLGNPTPEIARAAQLRPLGSGVDQPFVNRPAIDLPADQFSQVQPDQTVETQGVTLDASKGTLQNAYVTGVQKETGVPVQSVTVAKQEALPFNDAGEVQPTTKREPADENEIRQVLETRKNSIIDTQAIKIIAAQLGVKPMQVSGVKAKMREEERTAAKAPRGNTSTADVTAANPQKEVSGEILQSSGQKRPRQEIGKSGGQKISGETTAAPVQEVSKTPAAATPAQPVSAEENEVLDDDITNTSGEPFTIEGAAKMAANRAGDGFVVVPVEGGFVVRKPKGSEVSQATLEQQPLTVVPEQREQQDQAATTAKPVENKSIRAKLKNQAKTAPVSAELVPQSNASVPSANNTPKGVLSKTKTGFGEDLLEFQLPNGGKVLVRKDDYEGDRTSIPSYKPDGKRIVKGVIAKANLRDINSVTPENRITVDKKADNLPVVAKKSEQFKWTPELEKQARRMLNKVEFGIESGAGVVQIAENVKSIMPADMTKAELETFVRRVAEKFGLAIPESATRNDVLAEQQAERQNYLENLNPVSGSAIPGTDDITLMPSREFHAYYDKVKKAAKKSGKTALLNKAEKERVKRISAQSKSKATQKLAAPKQQERRTHAAERAKIDQLPVQDQAAEIAKLREQLAAETKRADTDTLTGVKSATAYRRDLKDAKAVASIDITLFKGYNTILTEQGGDAVLSAFGEAMERVAPGKAYRRGGDEFAFLSDTAEQAQSYLDALTSEVDKIEMKLTGADGTEYTVTGVPYISGVGNDEKSANAARDATKTKTDRNAVPPNVKPKDDAGTVDEARPVSEVDRGKIAVKKLSKKTEKPKTGLFSKPDKKTDQTATPEFKAWFGDSKVVDADGKPIMVFHGSKRPDRIGDRFRAARATSGPMAFFTENPDIASGYATGKQDTSLEHPDDYSGWFKFKPKGSRSEVDISLAWYQLTEEQRNVIREKLPHVTNTDKDGNEIEGFALGGENEYGLAGKGHWDWTIKESRGNVLKAAVEVWLNSAGLYGSENDFMEVLKLGGMPMDATRFDSPFAEYSAVIPVYLKIEKPFDTKDVSDLLPALKAAATKQRRKPGLGADQWDKRSVSSSDWMERLESDIKDGSTHAWTSIPDWVTETLKAQGFDGIKDSGGKNGGDKHTVWVPFTDTQVKSATGNNGKFDPTKPSILRSRPEPAANGREPIGAGSLQRRVDRVVSKWRGNIPTIKVVQEATQLPDIAKRDAGWFESEGFYDGNKTIWLVAHNLGNIDRAMQVLAHETFGHYGVESVVGKEQWSQIVTDVQKLRSNTSNLSPAVASAMQSTERRYGSESPSVFAREFIAVMAEKGVKSSLVGRMLAALRKFLRKFNFRFDRWSEAELREILAKGIRNVTESGKSTNRDGVARFSKREDQAETQAFKKWFGDSKVVDADGKPLVVYHGSPDARFVAEDGVFKSQKQRLGFGFDEGAHWFAASPRVAKTYADPMRSFDYQNAEEGIVAAYIKMESPLVINAGGAKWRDAQKRGKTGDVIAEARAGGHDGVIIRNVRDDYQTNVVKGDAPTDTYVVFNSTQIKSATGNSGAFDANNPNILFSRPDNGSTIDNIVISDKAKESVASVLKRLGSGKLTDLKPALLGSIPLNYLVDFAPKGMPSVKQFIELRQQLETFRNTQHQKYDAIAQRWLKYSTVQGLKGILGKSSEQGRILADFQNDSTVAGVDASKEYKPLEFTAEFRKRNEQGKLEIVQKKVPVTEAAIKNQIRIVQMNMKRAEMIAEEKSKGKNQLTKKKYDRALASRLDTLNERINTLDKLLRDENKRASDYPDLLKRYEALPQEGKELFALSRNAYKEQSEMIEQALMDNFAKARDYRKAQVEREYADRMKDISEDSDLSPEEAEVEKIRAGDKYKAGIKSADTGAAAKVEALRLKFETMKVQEPYFPLKRFGRYSIAVKKDGKTVGFMKRETFAEAEELAKEMGEKGYTTSIFLDTEKDAQRNAIDPRFIADLDEILDSSGVSDDVRDSIYQRYLETLPDLSLRKSFIHRKKTPGYDADTLRAFSSTMFHGSYQLARLKYGLDMKEAHNVSVDQAKRVSPVQGMALANEIGKRLAWIMNPAGSSTAQALTSAAFFWHLGANPAHLFLNATQTVMLGVPILGSKFGFPATMKGLAQATKDFAAGKGHIEKADLKPDEVAAMEAFYKMGLSDKTQSHDLAGVGETGAEYSAVRQRAMAKIGWFFHQSERFNREVTALTAYRLARDSGMSNEQAIKSAAENTWSIHFDYSSAARPRYLQGDVAKVLFVFRNYNINMLYRLFRDMHDAFRGDSPQVKKEAAKQLGAMLGMYGLMAGLTGVPFYGLMMTLAGLFDDKDEPFDAETRMKQGLVEFLGEDAAGVLLKGVPGSALGLDLSQRIGMPNLWFRSPDRELEGRDAYYYWMEQILGATPGIAKNIFTGMQQIHEGKVQRGVETMLPNMAKSPVRAMRYAWEGQASNLDGDQIAETGFTDVAKQALGFTPGSVSEQYEETGALKSADAKLLKRRQDIVSDYANASRENDSSGKIEAMDAMRKFNAKNPAYKITMDTLRKSLKTRAKNDQLNEGGIVLNKRLRALKESQN